MSTDAPKSRAAAQVKLSSRLGVSVRIRRGETTLDAKFDDLDTVRAFKMCVFGAEIRAGRQCRLIARGRELRDSVQMGVYNIEEGSHLHVMIGKEGSASRTEGKATSVATDAQEPLSGTGCAALFGLTFAMLASAWAALLMWPELFGGGSTTLLLLLTIMQGFLFMPFLHNMFGACRWGTVPERPRPQRRQ